MAVFGEDGDNSSPIMNCPGDDVARTLATAVVVGRDARGSHSEGVPPPPPQGRRARGRVDNPPPNAQSSPSALRSPSSAPSPVVGHRADQLWLPFDTSRCLERQHLFHRLSDHVRVLGLQRAVLLLEHERAQFPCPNKSPYQTRSSHPGEQRPVSRQSTDDLQKQLGDLLSIVGLQRALSGLEQARLKSSEIVENGDGALLIHPGTHTSFRGGSAPRMIVVPNQLPLLTSPGGDSTDTLPSTSWNEADVFVDTSGKKRVGRGGTLKCGPCRKAKCLVYSSSSVSY